MKKKLSINEITEWFDCQTRGIEEKLLETYGNLWQFWEFSRPIGKYKELVYNLSKPMLTHCIKIILFGSQDTQNIHHWAHELKNWLEQSSEELIKGTNKYPTTDDVIKWFKLRFKDYTQIGRIRKNVEKEFYEYTPKSMSDEKLYDKVVGLLTALMSAIPELTDEQADEIAKGFIE